MYFAFIKIEMILAYGLIQGAAIAMAANVFGQIVFRMSDEDW